MNKKMESGRSMIEMLGVLAIIGVLSVGGINMITKMQDSYETTQIIDETGDLANHAKKLVREYIADGHNAGSMVSYLGHAKGLPEALYNGYNDCGGNLCGTADTAYDVVYSSNGVFAVTVDNLSEEACMQMSTNNWGGPASSGFLGMGVVSNTKAQSSATDIANKVVNSRGTSTSSKVIGVVGNASYPAPLGIGSAANVCQDGAGIVLVYR